MRNRDALRLAKHPRPRWVPQQIGPKALILLLGGLLGWAACGGAAQGQGSLRERLKGVPFRVAYECYVRNNFDIFVMNADGSNPVNLTNSPDENEHYPQVSPDGKRLCFVSDRGEGRDVVRSLYVMDIDGRNRRKIADRAREPFWSPDGQVIGFLPQEYPKFNVIDYSTTGMSFYHLDSGQIEPHPNSAKLHHLYNPSFAPNGKWIAATVHAGMDFKHAILLIEAHGTRIIDLKIPGCRPCICPDGKQIAWGAEDHELATAPIDLDAQSPAVGPWKLRIVDKQNRIYHIDWSPDGALLSFSRGPESKGDTSKRGSFSSACEIMGVYAKDWDIWAVPADRSGTLDLANAAEVDLARLTTSGESNKEPAWFRAGPVTKE